MSHAESEPSKPWWREPYVWLVIGGPLVVVVAAIFTAVIAVSNPDPLIDKNATQQAGISASTDQAQRSGYDELQPAIQGRNHAASPVVPKVPSEK